MSGKWLWILLVGLGVSACANVPKEVVELSYRMGGDIEAVHKSYDQLIHDYFDMLRQKRLDYVNNEWTPKYIGKAIKLGRLVDIAKGNIVVSDDGNSFVKPVPGKEEAELLNSVNLWSAAVIEKIQVKKQALLKPLDDQEKQLLSWVDEAFNRLYQGNATITAHLNSLRKVQDVQDDALKALNMKDLRDKINDALINVSNQADKYMVNVRKADGIVQQAGNLYEQAKGIMKNQ